MTRFTQEDLNKLGLKDNGKGEFSKPKTLVRTIECKDAQGVVMASTHQVMEVEFESGKKKPKKKIEPVYFNYMNIDDVYEKCEKEGVIFIKTNVPSLKNSKQLYKNKKTGKNFITSSDLCKEYIKTTEIHWRLFRSKFLEMVEGKQKPYRIQLFFVRDSRRVFDYGNISEIIWDCMTGKGYYPSSKNKILNAKNTSLRKEIAWIEDDNCNFIIPDYSAGYGFDSKLAGVIIKVL